MKNKIIPIAVFALLSFLNVNSAFAGDATAGKEKSALCAACHGADGNGTDPSYPRLAGQHESYLAKAMHDYKSGDRKNPIMAGMVAALSDEDIDNLAAYFASMKGLKDLSSFK